MVKKKLELPKAKFIERVDIADDLAIFRFQPEIEFPFTPGQYATIGMEDGERLVERPYSIVSSPYEAILELFIELVPEGALTPLIFYKLKPGDYVTLRSRAKGKFTLDPGSRKHLMVATVTGIAPYISIVRTYWEDLKKNAAPDIEITILQGASRSWEFGYRDELEGITKVAGWLRYVPTVSRPWEDPAWTGETGRVETTIEKYLDAFGLSPSDTTAYLCGHPGMIKNGKEILAIRGFPADKVREEQYWVQK